MEYLVTVIVNKLQFKYALKQYKHVKVLFQGRTKPL